MSHSRVTRSAFAVLWLSTALAGMQFLPKRATTNFKPAHDFGKVRLTDEPARLSHVFRYRNELADRDEVVQVKSSCGCTTAKPSIRSLAPGESLDLPVSLQLTKPGLQHSEVWLIMKKAGLQTFDVRAVGFRDEFVTLVEQQIVSPAAQPAILHLIALSRDDKPMSPSVSTSCGEARFLGWTRVRSPSQAQAEAVRWHGSIEVRPEVSGDSTAAEACEVEISTDHDRIGRARIIWSRDSSPS